MTFSTASQLRQQQGKQTGLMMIGIVVVYTNGHAHANRGHRSSQGRYAI